MTSHTPTPDENSLQTQQHHDDHQNDTLSDIWVDDDAAATYQTYPYPQTQPQLHSHSHPHPHHHHPPHQSPGLVSDIPRLSHAHRTAGYRDGIAAAKARTAQAGFDEGYGLGATVGARAGQLLGVLEGLAAAVGLHSLALSPHRDGPRYRQGEAEARRLAALLAEARAELSVRGVFAGEYWAADGTWRYPVASAGGASGEGVNGSNGGVGGGGGGGGGFGEAGSGMEGLVVFADVAEAHPLLRKWSGIVRAEAARYGVDWEVLKDEVGEARRDEEEAEQEREGRMRRERENRPAGREREALAW
ncbi:uncharacterized protein THITE_2122150 [Thermothielavioides terrestris NRRL 8126]|uniref:Protein YAE1 n=1 Tax=Thermothielavioides terrestris (strain ATCC 38088 / NRRL 8126) TaxID=578455 RepID=G2RCA6_THETT|nr:uncharacterized protein THITE_2122150 [Thermothielavioides terrestris NRRL 8126]AEO70541.1 hypothetical protein THITE_2122150 [Thermothielavioides terrestris NRRL 8126]